VVARSCGRRGGAWWAGGFGGLLRLLHIQRARLPPYHSSNPPSTHPPSPPPGLIFPKKKSASPGGALQDLTAAAAGPGGFLRLQSAHFTPMPVDNGAGRGGARGGLGGFFDLSQMRWRSGDSFVSRAASWRLGGSSKTNLRHIVEGTGGDVEQRLEEGEEGAELEGKKVESKGERAGAEADADAVVLGGLDSEGASEAAAGAAAAAAAAPLGKGGKKTKGRP
jgi:hypothetical protein